jgi:capsular polysaccharide biosynthesis protein
MSTTRNSTGIVTFGTAQQRDPVPVGLTNLALRRPATQSSVSFFSKADTPEGDAAGGNNGDISGGFGFHTDHDNPAWWMVDLERICRIGIIRIHNRIGFAERLRHFSILISRDGTHWDVAYQKTDDTEFGGADGRPFHLAFANEIETRFIKIRQDDELFLHFDEFEAFGRPLEEQSIAQFEIQSQKPPSLDGEIFPEFMDSLNVATFGHGDRHERLQIMNPMAPPPQIPLRSTIAPEPIIREEHFRYPLPPAICAYAIRGAKIWGNGLITLNDRFVVLSDCLPHYLRDSIRPGGNRFSIPLLEGNNWAARQPLISQKPVACVLHPNLIFGHFLLEMLPHFYVLSLLRQYGASFSVALPTQTPQWVRPFVDLYFAKSEQIWYDPASQIIEAPSVILPSMMHESHNFHPAFNLMVADIRARAGLPPVSGGNLLAPSTRQRIYISRRLVTQNNRLRNEDEVETLMQQLGFTLVHPQRLSIQEQLVLFDGAELVVGEYSSALHNTLFCRPGTRVISLNFYSWYQSAIGRLRQQPHGFVAPDDGKFRHWRLVQEPERTYRISPHALTEMISAMAPKKE